MFRRAALVGVSTVLAVVGNCLPAVGAGQLNSISANSAAAITISGPSGVQVGSYVRALGDVNADGFNDALVETANPQRAYVLFLDPSTTNIDVTSPSLAGFRIELPENTFMGGPFQYEYSAGGDVNGDGKADVIIGAQAHNVGPAVDAGAVYVVFGKAGTGAVNLASIGSGGIEIDGRGAGLYTGTQVSGGGDVNGDGKDDILVSEGDSASGNAVGRAAWLVFGRASAGTIDLGSLGSNGYKLGNAATGPSQVAIVPDMNGDSKAETVVGGNCGGGCLGNSYVVFGRTTTSDVDVQSLGGGGFTVGGSGLGRAANAGDVNGDGRGDFIVSDVNASLITNHGGAGYVVFGKATTNAVDVDDVASGVGGFAVGGDVNWFAGMEVRGIGDVNGDGYDDVATGDSSSSDPGPSPDGAYVVLGGANPTSVPNVRVMPPTRGYRITEATTRLGQVDGGQQLAGDSARDLIAGASTADLGGATDTGAAFVIDRLPVPTLDYPSQLVYTKGTTIQPVDPSYAFIRHAAFSVSPALPAGLSLNPDSGVITGTPTTTRGAESVNVTMSDDGGQVTRAVSIRVDSDLFPITAPRPSEELATIHPVVTWGAAAASDATDGVDRYEVDLDGVRDATVASSACVQQVCSAPIRAVVSDGTHEVTVHAIDKTGRDRTSERSFSVAVPPTAALAVSPSNALTDDSVRLDASRSSDPNGSITRYEWDLDGNGTYETDTGSTPTVSRSYGARLTATVGVRVTDSGGLTAQASTSILIAPRPPAGPVGVSINDGAVYTNNPNVDLSPIWPRLATDMLVSNDGGFRAAVSRPVASNLSWRLDTVPTGGPDRYTRVIYVRFLGPGIDDTKTFSDDIVLDTRPPAISDAAVSPVSAGASGTATAATARKSTYKLVVKAKDDRSGVAAVQVATSRGKPLSWSKYSKAVRVRSTGRPVRVRAKDRAGNVSRWRKLKRLR